MSVLSCNSTSRLGEVRSIVIGIVILQGYELVILFKMMLSKNGPLFAIFHYNKFLCRYSNQALCPTSFWRRGQQAEPCQIPYLFPCQRYAYVVSPRRTYGLSCYNIREDILEEMRNGELSRWARQSLTLLGWAILLHLNLNQIGASSLSNGWVFSGECLRWPNRVRHIPELVLGAVVLLV